MQLIAIVSGTGGAGRTTVVANLATLLSRRGRQVLAVDLDPCNALAMHLGLPANEQDGLGRRAATGGAWQEAAFLNSDQVRLLPFGQCSASERANFELQLRANPRWLEQRFAELELPGDTVVLMDTPRLPSLYADQALCAAQLVLNVLTPDTVAYAGLRQLDGFLEGTKAPVFHLLNHVDALRRLQGDLLQILRAELKLSLSPYPLHLDEAVPESVASNQNLTDYAPHSQISHDFQGLASWVVELIGKQA